MSLCVVHSPYFTKNRRLFMTDSTIYHLLIVTRTRTHTHKGTEYISVRLQTKGKRDLENKNDKARCGIL